MRRLGILPLVLWAGIGLAAEPARMPQPPCLTCPKPDPACWMLVYRWEDYNLRAGLGTYVVVTRGAPPDPADLAMAQERILKGLPPSHKIKVNKTNRVACPEGAMPLR
ncbi:conserved hypothetical protein [Candidatus Terasakiella magnetica]|nr:conserved hypothetical protein [Candidatus Terasakiella magnetica]